MENSCRTCKACTLELDWKHSADFQLSWDCSGGTPVNLGGWRVAPRLGGTKAGGRVAAKTIKIIHWACSLYGFSIKRTCSHGCERRTPLMEVFLLQNWRNYNYRATWRSGFCFHFTKLLLDKQDKSCALKVAICCKWLVVWPLKNVLKALLFNMTWSICA